jgi:CBS domain-containing protein
MKVRDVMTTEVISVRRDTPVREIARLLAERRISAVPVVDEDRRVLGIVSEGDLVRRAETGTVRTRSWWLEIFADSVSRAVDYAKAHGRKAEDVMTSDVVTIHEDASLAEAATLLEKHRIKRLPVIQAGRIVGILSRANLIQALASVPAGMIAISSRDQAIRETLMRELGQQGFSTRAVNVIVREGVVQLWGVVTSEEERLATRVAAERIAGVQAIEDHLVVWPIVQWD